MNWRSMDDLPAILPWRQREFRWRLRALLGLGPVLAVLDGARLWRRESQIAFRATLSPQEKKRCSSN